MYHRRILLGCFRKRNVETGPGRRARLVDERTRAMISIKNAKQAPRHQGRRARVALSEAGIIIAEFARVELPDYYWCRPMPGLFTKPKTRYPGSRTALVHLSGLLDASGQVYKSPVFELNNNTL